MNPFVIILLFTCVNRLYRLAFFENYRHEAEFENFGFTAIGVSIIYTVIWVIITIIIQIYIFFAPYFCH